MWRWSPTIQAQIKKWRVHDHTGQALVDKGYTGTKSIQGLISTVLYAKKWIIFTLKKGKTEVICLPNMKGT